MPAQVSFVTEGHGRASALVLHQQGVERTAPRIDQAQAKAIENVLAKRVKEARAMPGAESALRRQLDGFLRGQPDYAEMSSDLAAITRPQLPAIQFHVDQLGALGSVTFLGVGSEGWDVYQAKFVNGAILSRILLTPDGKVSGLRLEWGP